METPPAPNDREKPGEGQWVIGPCRRAAMASPIPPAMSHATDSVERRVAAPPDGGGIEAG